MLPAFMERGTCKCALPEGCSRWIVVQHEVPKARKPTLTEADEDEAAIKEAIRA